MECNFFLFLIQVKKKNAHKNTKILPSEIADIPYNPALNFSAANRPNTGPNLLYDEKCYCWSTKKNLKIDGQQHTSKQQVLGVILLMLFYALKMDISIVFLCINVSD